MARPLRIEYPNALYHVTSRGDRQEDIYLDDEDRADFLNLLGSLCERMNWLVHAYCLMNNHYHLVIETPEGNLSRGMRQLNGIYTQTFNRRHHRVGHVFQGRYKAILVDRDGYLLELARYVVLNPVRANMVTHAGQWPWSSYRATAGQAERPAWLETEWLLTQFSRQRNKAVKDYQTFVRQGKGQPPVWENLHNQIYLGSETFINAIQKKYLPDDKPSEIPRKQRRPITRPLAYYEQRYSDRTQAIGEAYKTGDYTQQQIGRHFGIHYSTVSKAIRQYQEERHGKT